MSFIFCVPCLMGVEGLVADELRFGGFSQVTAENGRVSFTGEMEDAARANIWLRCGERVLLRMGGFDANTFDQLFEGVRAIAWEQFIPKDGAFPVKGYSIKSALHSVPACQSIIKKAIVSRLSGTYHLERLPETGATHQIQFSILNDQAEVFLDTTGSALYKRGYKKEQTDASLRETLAASMVKLARYRGREPFYDILCGAGTIPIEAAMAALNIAPGANRTFEAEGWSFYDVSVFRRLREEAREGIKQEKLPIIAMDMDPKAIELTRQNARRAGVEQSITIRQGLLRDFQVSKEEKGVFMTDPPYGIRVLDHEQAVKLYREMGQALANKPLMRQYILSPEEQFEQYYGKQSTKKRKLYNGMIKCNLYMYY